MMMIRKVWTQKVFEFLRVFEFFTFLDIYEELNFSTYLSQLGGISTNSVDDEKGPNNDTGLYFLFHTWDVTG